MGSPNSSSKAEPTSIAELSAVSDSVFFAHPLLALETSCDETSASVVFGQRVLSNSIASQIALHQKWGGVVPEAAARAHLEALLPTLEESLACAKMTLQDIRAIAVTNRPGLVGALSVGVTSAKALAYALKVPLLGIHHLEGHICSALACDATLPFPHVCLIVSGGHTEIVRVQSLGDYEILGQTLDDAAGEAYDKGARLLGLGYPGGQAIQEQARNGDPNRYSLPRGLRGETLDFSFSGLKTAVLRLTEKEGAQLHVPDAAAALQLAVNTVLVDRTILAATTHACAAVTLVGGVAANLDLRNRLAAACYREGFEFRTPPVELCTDNAAMIGLAASWRFAKNEHDDFSLDALANSPLP